jgi:hypothetical protein
MRQFETPLENQPDFLTFLKVTMRIMINSNREMYSFMINELIKARGRFIELNYQENIALIFCSGKKGGNSSVNWE